MRDVMPKDSTDLTRRSLLALAALNFFLADARDGLGPFLDAFLATRGWSSRAPSSANTATLLRIWPVAPSLSSRC